MATEEAGGGRGRFGSDVVPITVWLCCIASAWDVKDRQDMTPKDMKSKFPQHTALIEALATPGDHGDSLYSGASCSSHPDQCVFIGQAAGGMHIHPEDHH